jgi:glycosyltransferase involved in cell wall biosynthesis
MRYTQESVSAVIPAYNEEHYIGPVLDALMRVEEFSQILVVDDGSSDATGDVVYGYGRRDGRIKLLQLDHNLGKGGAMVAGADAVAEDLVVFLDADLIGIKPEHIRMLCLPVCWGECDMTLGLFAQGRRQTDLSHRLTPFLSGQRCLRWSLFRDAPEMGQARWGVEVALSLHAWRQHYQVQRVTWSGVTHAMRMEKQKGMHGYWSHAKMWVDIAEYFSRYFVFQQILKSRRGGSRVESVPVVYKHLAEQEKEPVLSVSSKHSQFFP